MKPHLVDVIRESRTKREEFKGKVLTQVQGSKRSNQRKSTSLLSKIRKLQRKEEQFQNAVLEVEVEARTTHKNAPQHSLLLARLRSELDQVRVEISSANESLSSLENDRDWVDWYYKFHRQVDEIDAMDDAQKQAFLTTIIQKINVTLDDQKKTHTLDIHFELPIVGDAIQWRNEAIKREGYQLHDGSYVASLRVQKKHY